MTTYYCTKRFFSMAYSYHPSRKWAILLACAAVSACATPLNGSPANAQTAKAPQAPQAVQSSVEADAQSANDPYYAAGQAALAERLTTQENNAQAKNLILFIGDGMGVSTITAGRIYQGQALDKDGPSFVTASDALPYAAIVKTYSHDTQVPDSAATATAIVAGVKTRIGVLGVSSGIETGNCESSKGLEVPSLFDLAEQSGRATGIISTARITHATPASTYAHAANRDWENDGDLPEGADCKDIAAQLVDWDAGDGFEVVMGGGRRNFLPGTIADPEYAGQTGRRKDGRNLIAEWQAKSPDAKVVYDMAGFTALDPAGPGPIIGLFEPSHMQYEADRLASKGGPNEPSLADMVTAAIARLQQDPDGFVLMVEGGRIDHAHHGGNAARALSDFKAFEEAIAAAIAATDNDDTLILVTADHSHVFTIAGYQPRNHPILGKIPSGPYSQTGDGKPYTTLGYGNGPGAAVNEPRADISDVDTTALDYQQQATVPLGSETHGGEDVVIKADGPRAHLFRGTIEQNVIFHLAKHALGL